MEEERTYPEPTLIRGLPLSVQEELRKSVGLTSAMKIAINALQGELVKLQRADVDLDDLDYDMLKRKPKHHLLATFNSMDSGETTPFYFAIRWLDTLVAVTEFLTRAFHGKDDPLGRGYGPALIRPDLVVPEEIGDATADGTVQPVATPRRVLDL